MDRGPRDTTFRLGPAELEIFEKRRRFSERIALESDSSLVVQHFGERHPASVAVTFDEVLPETLEILGARTPGEPVQDREATLQFVDRGGAKARFDHRLDHVDLKKSRELDR